MTVGRWLDALPRELLAAEPQLWLARAWTLMDLGELDEVSAWLEAAPEGDEWVGVLRALRLFKLGDVGGAARAAGAAVDAHDSADSFWRTVAAVVTGVAAHWRGRYDEARPMLRDAARIAAEEGNALARQYVLGYLALDAVEHDGPQAGLALLPEPPGRAADRRALHGHDRPPGPRPRRGARGAPVGGRARARARERALAARRRDPRAGTPRRWPTLACSPPSAGARRRAPVSRTPRSCCRAAPTRASWPAR